VSLNFLQTQNLSITRLWQTRKGIAVTIKQYLYKGCGHRRSTPWSVHSIFLMAIMKSPMHNSLWAVARSWWKHRGTVDRLLVNCMLKISVLLKQQPMVHIH